MPRSVRLALAATFLLAAAPVPSLRAFPQEPTPRPPREGAPEGGDPAGRTAEPGRDAARRGPPMGGMGQVRKILATHDKNGDHRLDAEERKAAREWLKNNPSGRGPGGPGGRGRGPGGPGGRGGEATPAKPGPKLSPKQVESYPDRPLYDPTIVRTLFLDFPNADWEAELSDFYHTDVEVPAKLTVDGKVIEGVGVRFRGASSFFGVQAGRKRSLNVSLDHSDAKARLLGQKTLNLLNSHEDPSFLHTVLYFHFASGFLPAPKANLVRVVINGESWGLYTSAEQFNKEMLAQNFPSAKGDRWKVPGSPNGQGGLDYVGDDLQPYKSRYRMTSGDNEEGWKALVTLCKTLSETPLDELEAKLTPMLDLEGVLRFLALEVVLVNNDGYWTRASDYALFRDEKGIFHVIPHDANETFALRGGMGGPGGPGGRRGRMGPPGGEGQGPEGFGPPRGGEGGFGPPPGGEGGPPSGEPGGPPAGEAGGAAPRERAGPPTGGGGANPPGEGQGRRPRGEGMAEGPGRMGPPGGGGVELDPLVAMNDPRKPLRSRLLAVPSLRKRYLAHVKKLAEDGLDWKNLGPVVARYRELIEKDVRADTRKLSSDEAFLASTADAAPAATPAPTPEASGPPREGGDPERNGNGPQRGPGFGGREGMPQSLRAFADRRRAFLLAHPALKEL